MQDVGTGYKRLQPSKLTAEQLRRLVPFHLKDFIFDCPAVLRGTKARERHVCYVYSMLENCKAGAREHICSLEDGVSARSLSCETQLC